MHSWVSERLNESCAQLRAFDLSDVFGRIGATAMAAKGPEAFRDCVTAPVPKWSGKRSHSLARGFVVSVSGLVRRQSFSREKFMTRAPGHAEAIFGCDFTVTIRHADHLSAALGYKIELSIYNGRMSRLCRVQLSSEAARRPVSCSTSRIC